MDRSPEKRQPAYARWEEELCGLLVKEDGREAESGISPSPPLRIQIDDRERNEALLAGLNAFDDVVLTICRLQAGDFQIDDAVLVERKTASDFAVSLLDGRLFTQAARLVREPIRPAMLLEGDAKDWRSLGVSREAIQGALISLSLVFDIPVLRSTTPEESARLLRYTGRQLLRARSEGQIPCRRVKAKRRSTRQRHILQALPGIGPGRAKRLLETFGSIRACLAADEKALASVEGIGAATAKLIVETVE